jgi:hypothetical protein
MLSPHFGHGLRSLQHSHLTTVRSSANNPNTEHIGCMHIPSHCKSPLGMIATASARTAARLRSLQLTRIPLHKRCGQRVPLRRVDTEATVSPQPDPSSTDKDDVTKLAAERLTNWTEVVEEFWLSQEGIREADVRSVTVSKNRFSAPVRSVRIAGSTWRSLYRV